MGRRVFWRALATCFAIEEALGLPAGSLSHHLGYIPARVETVPCTIARAVAEDERLDDIVSVQADWEVGAVAVTTRHGLDDLDGRMQKRTVTTGCGQGTVFGALMDDIEKIRLRDDVTLSEATFYQLIDNIRRHDSVYKSAGAVHGCALAQGADILMFIEDVGRHNAVDAIAGRMWLDGIDGSDKIFYTTGRLTSEMVIKCAQMQIPLLVSRSGLTQMGYEVANKTGITMIGRATGKHYLLFAGAQRFVK